MAQFYTLRAVLELILLLLLSHLVLSKQDQSPLVPPDHKTTTDTVQPYNIAIIGAGAAGSSTSYHMRQFSHLLSSERPLNITIFETNDRIGGRTTTVNALNDPRYPVELGASIFVEVNQILYNATRDFGLDFKTQLYESTSTTDLELGIWDGNQFVFTLQRDDNTDDGEGTGWRGKWKGYWSIAKLLWKYGVWSPLRTQRLAKTAVDRFLKLYSPEYFPFDDLTVVSERVGLLEFTGITGHQALVGDGGVSEKFAREIVQSSTRVNYAQNLGTIHGLESLVCMSINGATAVEGGNWRIFSSMVERSGAKVVFNSTVSMIRSTKEGKSEIVLNGRKTGDEFDTVVLAAPLEESKIEFSPPLASRPETVDYVDLYVTLFSTPYRPSPSYFGVSDQNEVPDSILTTLPEGLDLGTNRGEKAVGPADFWSISTLRILDPANDGYTGSYLTEGHIDLKTAELGKQYLYKIFSPKPVSAQWLNEVFAWNLTDLTVSDSPISVIPNDILTWHHEKKWHSYPYLPPRTQFDEFRLWPTTIDEKGKIIPNIWYTSAIEPFISTMETSALSGMNVARLIIDRLNSDE